MHESSTVQPITIIQTAVCGSNAEARSVLIKLNIHDAVSMYTAMEIRNRVGLTATASPLILR